MRLWEVTVATALAWSGQAGAMAKHEKRQTCCWTKKLLSCQGSDRKYG